jgi:DNA repair exonuclease SbcCD ATPase subunit
MKREMEKHALLLEGILTVPQRQTATGFIQNTYAPQSGEVFGILEEMKTTFDTNLAATQKDEAENLKAYEELKAAKDSEITAGKEQIAMKTQELANTDENNANAKQDLEDTKNSLSADEQFLMMLKEKCSMTDKEWEERQKTRQEEMEAVSKALAVLSSDDAHDLFTRTFSPAALLQKASTTDSKKRQDAAKLLSSVASKLHSPRLATLATQVRLDAFTRVKKAIDDMIAQLLKEKEDEIKHKDFCVDEFNTNQLQTEKKEREKEDLLAKIEDLELTIKTLAEAIEALKAEIAEMQVQLKRAGEDREKENKEFQMTVADQRETQKLLQAALSVLAGFYGKKMQPLWCRSRNP